MSFLLLFQGSFSLMILMVSLHLGKEVYVYYHPGIHTQHIFQRPSFDHFPTGDDPILYCKYSNIQLDGCTWVYFYSVITKNSRIFILHFCFMFRPSFFCLYFSSNLHWRSCTRITNSWILLQTQPVRGYNSDKKWHCSMIQKQQAYNSYILDISNRVLRGWDMLTLQFIQAWKKVISIQRQDNAICID